MSNPQNAPVFWSWQPQGATTAVGRVYAHVSQDIVTSALAAGSLITEGEVAASLGVSRTPVREAFLLLENQGLLKLFPKKGAVVTSIDPAETAHLLQVRVMLETRAVAMQAGQDTQANDASIAELQNILAQQDAARQQADPLAFAQADHQFHARVVAGAANPIIDDFYGQLGPRLARLTCRMVQQNAQDLQNYLDEHHQLLSKFAAADASGYEELLRQHVRSSL